MQSPSNATIRIGVVIILAAFCFCAFFTRLNVIKSSKVLTIDEIVYLRMGVQVKNDIRDYNTISYGEELRAAGRPLPGYFFRPLFKHPPVFTFLVALFLKIFGNNFVSAEYVSLLFGVLMIPLVYFFGKLLYDWKSGILSAFLVSLDPVSVICSQKIWMDTTLAFFMVLALYFFTYALKYNKQQFFIYSGIAVGFATLTKYPGVLSLFSIIGYALIYKRELFYRKAFLAGLVVPCVMFIPWFAWNFVVYGLGLISVHRGLHGNVSRFQIVGAFGVFIFGLTKLICKLKEDGFIKVQIRAQEFFHRVGKYLFCSLGILLLISTAGKVLSSFNLWHFPRTTEYQGLFSNDPPTFYFSQLIEFFPIYIFAFIALFIYQKSEREILRIGSFLVLLFYVGWGNYQSRYILAGIPLLLILASGFIQKIWVSISAVSIPLFRLSLKAAFMIFLLFILLKVIYINFTVSATNNMCYF